MLQWTGTKWTIPQLDVANPGWPVVPVTNLKAGLHVQFFIQSLSHPLCNFFGIRLQLQIVCVNQGRT